MPRGGVAGARGRIETGVVSRLTLMPVLTQPAARGKGGPGVLEAPVKWSADQRAREPVIAPFPAGCRERESCAAPSERSRR